MAEVLVLPVKGTTGGEGEEGLLDLCLGSVCPDAGEVASAEQLGPLHQRLEDGHEVGCQSLVDKSKEKNNVIWVYL